MLFPLIINKGEGGGEMMGAFRDIRDEIRDKRAAESHGGPEIII